MPHSHNHCHRHRRAVAPQRPQLGWLSWKRTHLDLGRPLDGLLKGAHGCELRLGPLYSRFFRLAGLRDNRQVSG
jgi:hypothetical protein